MRITALCISSLLIGFVSGGFVALPFFAPDTVVIEVPFTAEPTALDTCGNAGQPECPDPVPATGTSSIATTSTPTPTTSNNATFGAPAAFSTAQTHTYSDGLTVTLDSITDSRCKPDVQCIWAGELAPQLILSGGSFGKSVVQISLGTTRTKSLTQGAYTFTLESATTEQTNITVTKQNKTSVTSPTIPAVTKPTPTATAKPVATAVTTKPNAQFAAEVATLIAKATSKFRTEQSLTPFTADTALGASAKTYSAKLLAGNYLAHVDRSGCDLTCRFSESGYSAQSWGENLAMMEYEEQPSAQYVADFFMTQWQKSAGHRKNLLSPTFTHQGIGVSYDANNIYVTVHFALPK